jgi:hypothetical protein
VNILELPNELESDSEDLSGEEVASASPVASVDAMLKYLHDLRCHRCKQPIEAMDHALRRRAPFFYTRMTLRCAKGHEQVIVLRADWLSS